MPKIPLQVRLAAAAQAKVGSISKMSLKQIEAAQRYRRGEDPLSNLIFGARHSGVDVADLLVEDLASQASPQALPVRAYFPRRPRTVTPLIVHYHGGGWTLGATDGYDWWSSSIAHEVGAVVVSIDYRLAPQHKYPAAVEDAYRGLLWAAYAAAELGADPNRLAVMGDSAGGNLAAVVALLARERSGPALRHQALVYPATDLTLAQPSHERNADAPVLPHENVERYRELYLPEGADLRDPLLSPLHAEDLSGLPEAFIVVAGHDPLHDDGTAYAQRLAAVGVPVSVADFPRMVHGFCNMANLTRDAKTALGEVARSQIAALCRQTAGT